MEVIIHKNMKKDLDLVLFYLEIVEKKGFCRIPHGLTPTCNCPFQVGFNSDCYISKVYRKAENKLKQKWVEEYILEAKLLLPDVTFEMGK